MHETPREGKHPEERVPPVGTALEGGDGSPGHQGEEPGPEDPVGEAAITPQRILHILPILGVDTARGRGKTHANPPVAPALPDKPPRVCPEPQKRFGDSTETGPATRRA